MKTSKDLFTEDRESELYEVQTFKLNPFEQLSDTFLKQADKYDNGDVDALETAIWILCIVVKLTFFIYIIVQSFSFSFKKINKHRKIFSAFIGGVIAVILIFVSGNIVRFSFVSSATAAISVYVVPVIILPAILIGVNFIYDRRKNYEKN